MTRGYFAYTFQAILEPLTIFRLPPQVVRNGSSIARENESDWPWLITHLANSIEIVIERFDLPTGKKYDTARFMRY